MRIFANLHTHTRRESGTPASRLLLILLTLLFLLESSPPVLAETISTFSVGQLEFALDENSPTEFSISLHPKGGISSLTTDLTANVFAISGPSRLVIDVPGFSYGVEKKDKIQKGLIDGIRVGSHPDKTRFVVDIKNEAKPSYTVKTDIELEAIVIRFQIDESTRAIDDVEVQSSLQGEAKSSPTPVSSQAPVASNTPEPKKTPKNTTASTESADALLLEAIRAAQQKDKEAEKQAPEENAGTLETSTPETGQAESVETQESSPDSGVEAVLAPEEPADNSSDAAKQILQDAIKKAEKEETQGEIAGTVVKAIEFASWPSNKSNAVVIQMANPQTYELLPQGEDRYELRLLGAKLGASHLVIPQFPPETFKEFEVVMARQAGDTVVVQVYITKGTRLFPAKVDQAIWLKTTE